MQSDPNFGNFLIRPNHSGNAADQLVLLDFGALKTLDGGFTRSFRALLQAAHAQDTESVIACAIDMELMHDSASEHALTEFAQILMTMVEPLRENTGEYPWQSSQLPRRVAKRAIAASLSKHFAMPPVEFLLLMRKLTGVYTFIAALDARFNGETVIESFLSRG